MNASGRKASDEWRGVKPALHSLSGPTSYRKFSWSLEAVRFGFRLFQTLSAAQMPVKLHGEKIIITPNLAASGLNEIVGKTSNRLVNRSPGFTRRHSSGTLPPLTHTCVRSCHWDVYSPVWNNLRLTYLSCTFVFFPASMPYQVCISRCRTIYGATIQFINTHHISGVALIQVFQRKWHYIEALPLWLSMHVAWW